MRSKSYYRRFKAVFPDTEPELSPILARMSVLYEDLRIEHAGAVEPERIEALDVLPTIYRKFYFVRRSTITLMEFAGSFNLLQQQPGFARIRARFSDSSERRWREAATYFDSKSVTFGELKELRHDFGGHFQLKTARTALQWMDSDLPVSIEIVSDPAQRTAGPRLTYAYEVVVAVIAMRREKKSSGNEIEEIWAHARSVFELITDGWRHTVHAMHSLVAHHVLGQFR